MAKISDLKLDENNARKRGERASEALAHSLRQFGAARSVVMDADGVIRAGNGTVEAAKSAGIEKVKIVDGNPDELIVVRRNDLRGQDAVAYAIADNRTGELAEWDIEQLGAALDALTEYDTSDLGFGSSDLADIFPQDVPEIEDVEPQIDRADELSKEWGTAEGQLWVIEGQQTHRLLCGDSTDEENVKRLMGEHRAGLMNTDPPYGVGYANDERPNPGVAKPRVANDTLSDESLQTFLESTFRAACSFALREDAAWYLWHAHLTQGCFAAAAAAAAVVLHRQIIWVKPVLLLGRGQYHWRHEPCFMGWVEGNQPPDYGAGNGERTQTTVWEVGSITHEERREFNHSTPKPAGLFTIPIIKHLRQGEVAYEPFAGSGPQFVAAEAMGMRCFGLEIEPKYCAVILQRMKDAGCECRLQDA